MYRLSNAATVKCRNCHMSPDDSCKVSSKSTERMDHLLPYVLTVKCSDCQMSWLSNVPTVKCPDCQMSWLSNVLTVKCLDCQMSWLADVLLSHLFWVARTFKQRYACEKHMEFLGIHFYARTGAEIISALRVCRAACHDFLTYSYKIWHLSKFDAKSHWHVCIMATSQFGQACSVPRYVVKFNVIQLANGHCSCFSISIAMLQHHSYYSH